MGWEGLNQKMLLFLYFWNELGYMNENNNMHCLIYSNIHIVVGKKLILSNSIMPCEPWTGHVCSKYRLSSKFCLIIQDDNNNG